MELLESSDFTDAILGKLLVGYYEDAHIDVKTFWHFLHQKIYPGMLRVYKEYHKEDMRGDQAILYEKITASDEALVMTILQAKKKEVVGEIIRELALPTHQGSPNIKGIERKPGRKKKTAGETELGKLQKTYLSFLKVIDNARIHRPSKQSSPISSDTLKFKPHQFARQPHVDKFGWYKSILDANRREDCGNKRNVDRTAAKTQQSLRKKPKPVSRTFFPLG